MSNYSLAPPEARAVAHLLDRSALATCAGTSGRIELRDRDLMLAPDGWGWSFGEQVLLHVIGFILGRNRLPDLAAVDEHERLVVREALRMLAEDEARAEARLLRAGRDA